MTSKHVPVTPGHNRSSITRLLIIGLVFHVIYIASVFDCYFTSPVVHGMKYYSLSKPQAKRIVLFVGDGLRADLLFDVNGFASVPNVTNDVAPYLRSIAETRGAFGISHTRVPTESRPGHVALIGGMYEDVSAVTKGWKTNPVDFDSVFNQSSHTFSFGSPDILPMFARGATPGKVMTWSYNEEEEDFTKDATALDVWVLDHLRQLFSNATKDPELDKNLRSEKTVIFLHLLGLDTTGHSYKPFSKEYAENIRVVDDIVRETESLVSAFYGDSETAYILTADHGMSVRGNHGDGDPDNTRTPIVAWGRSISGPVPDMGSTSHDEYSSKWTVSHLLRRDINQADVAALMATVLGIDWPVNSVGVLPDVDPAKPGYLDLDGGDAILAEASLVNAKVILEQYNMKHNIKKEHSIQYLPFSKLEAITPTGVPYRESAIQNIETLIKQKHWIQARAESAKLIDTTLEGLKYLHTYDRTLIRAIVTAGYIGWAAYSSLFIFGSLLPAVSAEFGLAQSFSVIDILASAALALFFAIFAVQRHPWTFYVYISFPVFFWHQVASRIHPMLKSRFSLSTIPSGQYLRIFGYILLVIGALYSMVQVGYTDRRIWSFGLVTLGLFWPLTWGKNVLFADIRVTLFWVLACLATAVFPSLPLDSVEDLKMIVYGSAAMGLSSILALYLLSHEVEKKGGEMEHDTMSYFYIELILLACSWSVTRSSVKSLHDKNGLPKLNQYGGWFILTFSSILPFISYSEHPSAHSRILSLFLGLAPSFVILTNSTEGLFYLAYTVLVVTWIEVEALLRQRAGDEDAGASAEQKSCLETKNDDTIVTAPINPRYEFKADDLRIALFFLFFIQIAFFGTGNVASISSFYLQPVYRLVPIFSPFLMATLLIFKILAPYVILSAAFATLHVRLGLPPFSIFLVALALTDGMTLFFFYNVTDTGSWLEIGQSISFFCITSLLLVFSAGICAAGEWLMAGIPPTIMVVQKAQEDVSSSS